MAAAGADSRGGVVGVGAVGGVTIVDVVGAGVTTAVVVAVGSTGAGAGVSAVVVTTGAGGVGGGTTGEEAVFVPQPAPRRATAAPKTSVERKRKEEFVGNEKSRHCRIQEEERQGCGILRLHIYET